MNAARLLHEHAGSPFVDGCGALDNGLRCWLCGLNAARGMLAAKWMGANFTDQNRVRAPASEHVCESCVWVCSWIAPPGHPGAAEGKQRPPSMRMFSHLYDERGYIYAMKDRKPLIRDWLRAPKRGRWFAAIADGGKKQLLPWTPINDGGSGGAINFEQRIMHLPAASAWALVDAITDLLSWGITKAEVGRGEYGVNTCRDHWARVRDFEHINGRDRGGAWFDLALWLAQRDEEEYERRTGKASSRAATARTPRSVSRERRIEPPALGSDRGQAPSGGADNDDAAGVCNQAGAGSARESGEQGRLFRN